MSVNVEISHTNGFQEKPKAVKTKLIDSADVLRGKKSVPIVHNGVCYQLQATKLGKLILTK